MDLSKILESYLQLPNRIVLKQFLQDHPLILSEEAIMLLSEWILRAENHNDIGRANALKNYKRQLQMLITQGVEEGLSFHNLVAHFLDMETFTNIVGIFIEFCLADNAPERRKILEIHPELLTASARELLMQDEVFDQILSKHPIYTFKIKIGMFYLDIYRELGPEEAEKRIHSQRDSLTEDEAELFLQAAVFPSVIAVLMAQSLATVKEIIHEHPELLTPDIDTIFETLISNACRNERWEQLGAWAFYHKILIECRHKSPDIVFKNLDLEAYDVRVVLASLVQLASLEAREQEAFIQQTPSLLSLHTDTLLDVMCRRLEYDNKHTQAQHYREWQLLLRACREIGIQAVFEFISPENHQNILLVFGELFKADNWDEVQTIVQDHKILLSPLIDVSMFSLEGMLNRYQIADLSKRFEKYRLMLKKCRDVGIPEAIRQMKLQGALPSRPEPVPINDSDHRVGLVIQFINTEDWIEAREVIEKNKELLSEKIDFVFNTLLEHFKDQDEEVTIIRRHWNILRACREKGIEEVFVDLLREDPNSS